MAANHGPVPSFTLAGKIVLITGGGSGIGLAFAQLCQKAGACVILGDLKLTPEAETYISSQPKTDNNNIIFERCDVTSWSSLQNLISASISAFADVPDIYAPVAGVLDPSWSNFWDDTEATSYTTVAINVMHPLKLTRLAIRALLSADKQGVVCLVASTAGIRGNSLFPLYTATKHAIVGFAKSMGSADVEQGVKIVCVLPGAVRSPLWEDRDDDVVEATRYKERDLMVPGEIAVLMGKMVEDAEYSGGTCVLKTTGEERVVEEGWDKQAGKYDPSPRPDADMSRQRAMLDAERGRKWIA